jgi:hypothetical protein
MVSYRCELYCRYCCSYESFGNESSDVYNERQKPWCVAQSSGLWRDDNATSVNDQQFANTFLEVVATTFNSLPGHYPSGVHVDIPDSHPTMEATVASIAAEATATCVTHPRTDVFALGSILGLRSEGAVIVDMVMATAYGNNALFFQCFVEARVEAWCGARFSEFTTSDEIALHGELRKRYVDEGHIEMDVSILGVLRLEALSGLGKPLDLVRLDPIVTSISLLIRTVAVRVEEIQSDGRVLRRRLGQDLDIVVADSINVVGSGSR